MRLVLAFALLAACKAPAPEPTRVAAAADLSRAFDELGRLYEQRTGQKVVVSFGASGQLARQLGEGAPFDVFAAANVAFAEQAVKSGACEAATLEPYGRGRLAVFVPGGPAALADLGGEQFKRIAIANPETAPYGRAAKEALIAAGLWQRVQPRLVFGENVRQTLQLAETGNVEAALVAHALVMGRREATPVDEGLHPPLVQAVVRCRHGKNAAGGEAFVKLLRSDEGVALLKRYGFEPP